MEYELAYYDSAVHRFNHYTPLIHYDFWYSFITHSYYMTSPSLLGLHEESFNTSNLTSCKKIYTRASEWILWLLKFFFIFRIFSHKYKLYCWELIYNKKIILNSKNICFEVIQNGGKSRLEQSSVIKFLVAKKWKQCEIYWRLRVWKRSKS